MSENPPAPTPRKVEPRTINKYGTPAQKTPQVDWQVTDDGRGLLTGTLKYFYDIATGKPLDGGTIITLPARGELHAFDERLMCKDVATTVGSNDIGYCDANYVGLSQDPTLAEWSISCPTEEDPIQTHPMFSIKSDKQGSFGVVIEEAAAPTYQPRFDPEMAVLGGKNQTEFERFKVSPKCIEKDLVGVESYKVPRQTMSISFHTAQQSILSSYLTGVGKQFTVVDFAPSFTTSSSLDGRTWLFTSLSVSEFSGIYKLDCEYTLSGYGSDGKGKPWNKLIYQSGTNLSLFGD